MKLGAEDGFYLFKEFTLFRARNSCFFDIEINAWSPLFVNLQINLIFNRYPEKEFKIQPTRVLFAETD